MSAEIKFIGTSSARTSLNRFHSSFLITTVNHVILVDSGDSITHALLKGGVDTDAPDAVLITHPHADHLAGLPSLISQWKINGRKKPAVIYTHEKNLEGLETVLKQFLLFRERMDFPFEIKTFGDNQKIISGSSIGFIAKENSHLHTYSQNISGAGITAHSGSFMFTIEGSKVFYSGDVGSQEDLTLFTDSPDVYICEITHVKPEDIFRIADSMPETKFILTHISGEQEDIIRGAIEKMGMINKIEIAYDGLSIPIKKKDVPEKPPIHRGVIHG